MKQDRFPAYLVLWQWEAVSTIPDSKTLNCNVKTAFCQGKKFPTAKIRGTPCRADHAGQPVHAAVRVGVNQTIRGGACRADRHRRRICTSWERPAPSPAAETSHSPSPPTGDLSSGAAATGCRPFYFSKKIFFENPPKFKNARISARTSKFIQEHQN
jgi:hypothetical protein